MRKIPLDFACSVIPLSWNDIKWACEKSILDWKDAQKFALDALDRDSASDVLELSMTDSSKIEEIIKIVGILSEKEVSEKEVSKNNWLIITLSWLYQEKDNYSDPFGLIEQIYADFDYPSEIESIVRYMPTNDGYNPSLHSFEDNEKRLIQNWKTIINKD